ncbi:MAG: transcriptional regulator [Bacteroidales bacterium]|jgi:transcriptional regulator with XRE-family HTH domain|nr:transcriptional regulator [Bacteroidales bacterium]MBQ1654794.1 transcriptional regulator [Bacteroidales bacterium]MBQ1695207.1 transcriptional regulator [Bacteroidales bacterium]MBQ1732935.1 transcriptional regulator [Bacteroidales bacterium]MBQ2350815.1 transcriptional regulator [Bacteroidales bacterium]
MTKKTNGNLMPRKLAENLRIVGEQIRMARLRRNFTLAQIADRAMCSELTVARVEKGLPTVSIGIYLRVLYAMQLENDILCLAKDDELGRNLQDLHLKQRKRASKKE